VLSLRKAALIVATGFGSGYLPRLPGTAGSFLCLALWYLLGRFDLHRPYLFLAVVTVVGTLAIRVCLTSWASEGKILKDPGFIVIDEWAGMLLSLIPVSPQQPYGALSACLQFRLFDMVKPGPVAWAERLPGEWGIMADDIVAGLLSLAVLAALGIP